MNYLKISIVICAFIFVIGPAQASAKDDWVQVRSKNFFLIGDASEKEIRRVGTKLEQFRESFRLLFTSANLVSPIPTNVIVFKNNSSYKAFKPKRADGKVDEWIAGYFQPGEDVNYITLSAGGDDRETYGTIFHEYVHFIINTNFGRSDVPQWFNEGLAEYYQTFEIADDIKIKLGLPQSGHLNLLQQSQLMPLEQLLNVTNYQLHQTGGHSRSIFYAQSWALVHYLTQGGKSEALNKYLTGVIRGADAKSAFEEAFQTTYTKMEKDLRNYISKNSYNYHEIKFKLKLDFESGMQVLPLDEAHSNAYLGDLLSHSNRADDAEPYLVAALKLKPDLGMASTSLGMVKIKQRKFDEARVLLERAIAGDPKNHLAYYRYAYLLSREGRDEFGFVQKFEPSTAERMRDSLKKAIAINPSYTESYEMLAFVALVNNDQLEEAGKHLQTALKYQPGNQRYILRLAELLIRQLKFDEAKTLADKVEANAEDDETRSRAGSIRSEIQRHREFAKAQDAEKKRYEAAVAQSGGTPRLVRRTDKTDPSPAEISRIEEAQRMRALNEALRVPDTGETRVLGRIEKIDCKKRPIVYSVKTATESFSVSSLDFAALTLVSLDSEAVNAEMGCDADLKAFTVLLTYKVATAPKSPIRGELIAVEFVPSNFRLMSEAEMQAAVPASYNIDEGATQVAGMPSSPPRPTTTASTQDFEARRREMIMQSIRAGLTKPGTGEKQELGFLDKIECNDKNFFFHIRTTSQTIKLRPVQNSQPRITVYTPDLTGVQFGCGTKPIEFPVVFTFADKPDKKSKTAGELIALEFVPKSFSLEP